MGGERAQCHHEGPGKRETGRSESVRGLKTLQGWFGRWGKGPRAKKRRFLQKLEQAGDRLTPGASRACRSADTLILTQ